jgi:hypothetical protein
MKSLSLTWPWNWTGTRWSFEQTIQEIVALRPDRVALRAIEGPFEYGGKLQTKVVWKGRTYRDLERALKALPAPIPVDVWGPIYLRLWEAEARLLRGTIVPYYNPPYVFLDVEGDIAQKHIANLGPFLRALGRLPCKVYLQSYRYAPGNSWMQWEKWLKYRVEAPGDEPGRPTGLYIIDGLAHQLYPIGETNPSRYLAQVARDVQSHEVIAQRVGRPDIPWFPTLPAFIGTGYEAAPGWKPSVEGVSLMVEWLRQNLGTRLVGINFWSLDKTLYRLPELATYIANLQLVSPETPPPAPLPVPLEERVATLEAQHQPGGAHP